MNLLTHNVQTQWGYHTLKVESSLVYAQVPVLSQMNSLHKLSFLLFNVNYSVMLPPIHRSMKLSLSFRFSKENL